MMESIYLDFSATTPTDPSVIAAMSSIWGQIGANPASLHGPGRQAKCVLEDTAEDMIRLLGGDADSSHADQIVFTSGGTEANNLALLGSCGDRPGRMVVSRIEHPSTIAAAIELQRRGWQIDWIRAEESGLIDLNHCRELVCSASQPPPRLVSLMLANNETGVVQPVGEVVDFCGPRGIPVHTDAVQAMGRSPVRFDDLGVTLMTVAAHKFHGPTGIGALLVRGRTSLQPILFGGSQQLGMRPGTEPVALAVGMKRALELAMERLTAGAAHLRQVRDSLEIQLMSLPEARVNGTAERLPHSLNMSFLGLDRQALLMALDLAGVYCSTGSACSSGSSEPSHVLQAMGLSGERVASALRFSVGMTTKLSDVTLAGERILNAVNQLRS